MNSIFEALKFSYSNIQQNVPEMSFSEPNKTEFLIDFVKYLNDHHFTVQGCKILEFCDKIEENFENLSFIF